MGEQKVVPARDSRRGLELLGCRVLSCSLAVPGRGLCPGVPAVRGRGGPAVWDFSKPDCRGHVHPETPEEGLWVVGVLVRGVDWGSRGQFWSRSTR